MNIFVDTSAIYALLDGGDSNHRKAKEAWSEALKPENALVTTNYILLESFALIQSRLGLSALRGFQSDIVPLLGVEWIGEDVHARAVSALLAASRKSLSLADCTSFEVMRALSLTKALSFDSHFTEQGFSRIP